MDVTSINSTANLMLNERYTRKNEEAAEQADAKGQESQSQNTKAQPVTPEQVHQTQTIRPELVNGYHGLTVQQARREVGQVAALISNTNPWKLVEIQPVLDRNILGGGYY
jgi:hypothetical protein